MDEPYDQKAVPVLETSDPSRDEIDPRKAVDLSRSVSAPSSERGTVRYGRRRGGRGSGLFVGSSYDTSARDQRASTTAGRGPGARRGVYRRPIVVRDPRDGSFRIVGGNPAARGAPIRKIINGHGGRRIVVRDPAAVTREDQRNNCTAPSRAANVAGVALPTDEYQNAYRRRTPHGEALASESRQKRATPEKAKLFVQNLDPGVTDDDIYELFSSIGPLVEAFVMYNVNGQHTGCAEVTFQNINDAIASIKRYNSVPLDNRPLWISLVDPLRANQSIGYGCVHPEGPLYWNDRNKSAPKQDWHR